MEELKNIQFPFLKLDLVLVEGGIFEMGDQTSDLSKASLPVHQVRVDSFYMCKHQVTQHLWEAVMGNNPSRFKGENRPVETISWDNAQKFIKNLNKETGKGFRLPTESEWEYAARGGKYSQGYIYAGSDKLKQVGWYDKNSNNETHEVGLLLSNELDLYDMSGNVWEWCEDDYHDKYDGAPKDGSAWIDSPKRGVSRVVRGGSCFNGAVDCRPTARSGRPPGIRYDFIGFRLVLPLQSAG